MFTYVCVCSGLWTPMDCPNYEVVRILTQVPTSDRGQIIPRHWVPDTHSFKSDETKQHVNYKRRIVTNTKDNEQRKDTRGTNFHIYRWDFQFPRLWHEEHSFSLKKHLDKLTITRKREIPLPRVGLTHFYFPLPRVSQVFDSPIQTKDTFMKDT